MDKLGNASYTLEELTVAVEISFCVLDVIDHLGLRSCGATYLNIKHKVEELNLDTSHWKEQKKGPKGHRQSLDQILVKDSSYKSSTTLKKRLIRAGLLEYRCYTCGINEWQNKEIVLELDHKNGDRFDHRLDNLRLLCPNCHSQTVTFSSKNKKEYKISDSLKRAVLDGRKKQKHKKNKCKDCGKGILPESTQCKSCYGKAREKTKIDWPSVEELYKMVHETSYKEVGRKLGVSDNAVRKRLKNHA